MLVTTETYETALHYIQHPSDKLLEALSPCRHKAREIARPNIAQLERIKRSFIVQSKLSGFVN